MASDKSITTEHSVARDTALRDLTRQLVETAERVVDDGLERWMKASGDKEKKKHKPPEKTQFSKLASVCRQAACAAEITNYLRYQVGRGQWPLDFAKDVIEAMERLIASLDKQLERLNEQDREAAGIEAWRRYAVFMARRFTYRDKSAEKSGQGARA